MNIKQRDFYPLKDNIVVKVPQLKKKSDGDIIIPDSVLEKRAKELGVNMFLEVISVGPDTKQIKVGMKILTQKKPMELPFIDSDDEAFVLGFVGEYAIEGYI